MKSGAAAWCCPWLPPFAELLSRGSQVRVLPGALLRFATKRRQAVLREAPRLARARRERFRVLPGALFHKEFADFDPKENRRECTSNRVISPASSRHISRRSQLALPLSVFRSLDFQASVHTV